MRSTGGEVFLHGRDRFRIFKNHWQVILGIVALSLILTGNANAAEIQVTNFTTQPTTPTITNMSAYLGIYSDANESQDSHDGDFLNSLDDYAMEVSSNEPGVKSRINAKPFNTPCSTFDLGFYSKYGSSYPKTINNKIKARVNDANGLEHRKVYVFNSNESADPNLYPVAKDGTIQTITLPNLINPSQGIYATWVIQTPANVEGDNSGPSGTGLLDGTVDFYDIRTLGDEWLQTTDAGQNYLNSDVDYSRITDFQDFAIMAKNWRQSE